MQVVQTKERIGQFEKLFERGRIGKLGVQNRLVMTATGFGVFSHDLKQYGERIEYYIEARARGGVGAMILSAVGAARIDDLDAGEKNLATMEASIPWLRRLAEVAHASNTPIGIQLSHEGRQGRALSNPPVAPSAVPWSPRSPIPRELGIDEIENLISRFGRCAAMVREAGFDFIEIHGGHGYLIHEFLSPRSNLREDDYGGDESRRLRFPVELLRRVRQSVGPDFPLVMRVSGDERTPNGLSAQHMVRIVPKLIEAGALDLLNVSGGAYGSNPVIVGPYYVEPAFNLASADALLPVVSIPLLVSGRVWDPVMMNDLIASGRADFIGLARPLWADPDLPNKLKQGVPEDVRPCIACNQGCIDRVGKQLRTCTVNPLWASAQEREISLAKKPLSVLVVGGGPAGLEAARVAAARGCRVVLLERESQLGGKWRLAALTPQKEELLGWLRWIERQLKLAGVQVRTGVDVDPAKLSAFDADVVVVATGARLRIPDIPRPDGTDVQLCDTALAMPTSIGQRVLILGAGRLELETADFLAERGRSVCLVAADHLGNDLGATIRFHLLNRLKRPEVRLLRSGTLVSIVDRNRALLRVGTQDVEESFDTLLTMGLHEETDTSLSGALRRDGRDVRVIGDAARPRDGLAAIADGSALSLSF